MTVLYNVNQMAGDLYIEMETDVFFDIKMVTTDKTQRRGGLATDLLRRSVELARNLGFKAVKTEATGMYVCPFWLRAIHKRRLLKGGGRGGQKCWNSLTKYIRNI